MKLRRTITENELKELLSSINGRGYGFYKRLLGLNVRFRGFMLRITHVQGDPHAPPSFVEVRIPKKTHQFSQELMSKTSVIPFTDYLTRKLYSSLRSLSRKCGIGNSCFMGIPRPSPRILKRSSVEVIEGDILLRFFIGLPAEGRRVFASEAKKLLMLNIERAIKDVLEINKDLLPLKEHIRNFKLQEEIRTWLTKNGYFFFVGEGSVLPRKASFSEEPLPNAVKFRSPATLRVKFCTEDDKCIIGMGIKDGVVMITGGAYHGKSTLLRSIIDGIYDHVKGDGRELVISSSDSCLVRAEDGRVISHVDISSFMRNLPDGTLTSDFSTLYASGSTSMAAAISECIEAGSKHILLDEDISATNLLYKDNLMERILINDPIIPLNRTIRSLYRRLGVSTAAVISASSSFLDCSDTILLMHGYIPEDLKLKGIRAEICIEREVRSPRERMFRGIRHVRKLKASAMKIIAEYMDGAKFEIDLSRNPRVVEAGQVRLIAHILRRLSRLNNAITFEKLVKVIEKELKTKGFKAYSNPVPPDLTMVDPLDVIWVINRLFRADISQR